MPTPTPVVEPLIREHGAQIKALYAMGWSAQRIADSFNVAGSPSTREHVIFRALKKMGIPLRKRTVRGRAFMLRSRYAPRIAELYEGGATTYQIADKFKVTDFLIRSILKEEGVKMRIGYRPAWMPPLTEEQLRVVARTSTQKAAAVALGMPPWMLARREERTGLPQRYSPAFKAWRQRQLAQEAA